MGFYNYIIYRILKNIFWKLKKHKKLIIFILIFILYLIISNKCFAYENKFDYSSQEYTFYLPDGAYNAIQQLDLVKNQNYYYFAVGANARVYIYLFPTYRPAYLTKGTNNTDFNFQNFDGAMYAQMSEAGSILQNPTAISTLKQASAYGVMSQRLFYYATDMTIYTDSSLNTVFYTGRDYVPPVVYTPPRFVSTASELENINNKSIKINGGSFSDTAILRLYNHTTNSIIINNSLSNYDDYIEREDLENPFSDLIYNIPYSAFNSFNLLKDNEYEWRIVYTDENGVLSNVSLFFTPTLNESINDTTNKDINDNLKDTNDKLDNIEDSITDTNDKLDNIEDSITDSNVDIDVESDLPSVNVDDPTQNGINNIFNSIYNAFCTGEAQDIVLPIPYTEKDIRISPYYVRDMLNNNGVGWLYIFIQAFWAYLFGRYIIKDISNKINKIKSGDIDDIQNTNIKEEML